MREISFSEESLLFATGCVLITICYVSYWFLSHSEKFINYITRSSQRNTIIVLAKGTSGFMLMGIVPVIVLVFLGQDLTEWGLNLKKLSLTLKWAGLIAPIILVSAYFASKNRSSQKIYPSVRNRIWTTGTFAFEFASWGIYLLGYEFLFRGVFLFAALKVTGSMETVFLGSVIYSLAHLPKGSKETFGSFIVGLGMSYMTILTGSIFFSLLLHIIMAWSNSFFSFLWNPDMKFNDRK